MITVINKRDRHQFGKALRFAPKVKGLELVYVIQTTERWQFDLAQAIASELIVDHVYTEHPGFNPDGDKALTIYIYGCV